RQRMRQAGRHPQRASQPRLTRHEGAMGFAATKALLQALGRLTMLKKIHHVGVVVPDLERALELWRGVLGLHLTKSATIQDQGVKAALLKVGECEIELLE